MTSRSRDEDLAPIVRLVRGDRTLTGEVVRELRTLILDGRLPPGMPLRLHALAERLGVSVMPVREALRQLEAERLVRIRPHRGAIVTELSRDELEEQYVVRAALEGLAAGIAAREVTNAQRQELEVRLEAIDKAARAGDLEAFLGSDRAFHRAIYGVTGRSRLQERIAELSLSTRRAGLLAYADWQADPQPGVEAHRQILDAVKAGDAALAERLTTEHVRFGGQRVLHAVTSMDHRRAAESGPPDDDWLTDLEHR